MPKRNKAALLKDRLRKKRRATFGVRQGRPKLALLDDPSRFMLAAAFGLQTYARMGWKEASLFAMMLFSDERIDTINDAKLTIEFEKFKDRRNFSRNPLLVRGDTFREKLKKALADGDNVARFWIIASARAFAHYMRPIISVIDQRLMRECLARAADAKAVLLELDWGATLDRLQPRIGQMKAHIESASMPISDA
jgi:hypothetical protein